MHPSESQSINMPVININGQALPNPPERVQTTQPRVSAPMGMFVFFGRRLLFSYSFWGEERTNLY